MTFVLVLVTSQLFGSQPKRIQPIVLGIPHHAPDTNKKGCEIICELTMNLERWKLAEDMENLVFDTRASNNGYVSAACGCVQKLLQCPF